jgi:hypothetical protein
MSTRWTYPSLERRGVRDEGKTVIERIHHRHWKEDRDVRVALRIALVLSVIAGVASAATLDRNGTWAPSDSYTPPPIDGVRALINDGSFENGPPPASAWTEVSDQACEWIGDWTVAWGVAAIDGIYDYWGGGYCGGFPTTSSVTQTVLVPAGSTTLSFYYIAYRPDADDVPADGDHGYLKVNGVDKWTLPFVVANNTFPNWVGPFTVDLSAYVGQNVALSFGAVSVGSLTGNIRVDYVEFVAGPTPTENTTWGAVKSIYR